MAYVHQFPFNADTFSEEFAHHAATFHTPAPHICPVAVGNKTLSCPLRIEVLEYLLGLIPTSFKSLFGVPVRYGIYIILSLARTRLVPIDKKFPVGLLILLQYTATQQFPAPYYCRVAEIGLVETAIADVAVIEYYDTIEKSPVEVAELYTGILECTVLYSCVSEVAPLDYGLAETAMYKLTLFEADPLEATARKVHTLELLTR